MAQTVENIDIGREAKRIHQNGITVRLADIFFGLAEGTEDERARLKDLEKQPNGRIYSDIIYALAHQTIEDGARAKKLCEGILVHQIQISEKLGRQISYQTAAIDYLQSVEGILKEPTILEDREVRLLAEALISDPRTQVYDGRLLDSDLDQEIDRAERYGNEFSVLFLDVDNFKSINDRFGHEAGNKFLRHMSDLLKQGLRISDKIYRYGGDEFVILLPGQDTRGAKAAAWRIRRKINGFGLQDPEIRATVSIGVATYGIFDIKKRKALLEAADTALYLAKKRGKNRICVFSSEGQSHEMIHEDSLEKREPKIRKRTVARGIAIAPGVGAGRAYHYRDVLTRDLEIREIEWEEIKDEMARIQRAMKKVEGYLDKIKKNVSRELNSKEASIFAAQKSILNDPVLKMDLERELKEQMVNAEQIVREVFRRWENRFKELENENMREKAADIADLGRHVLQTLIGSEGSPLGDIPQDSILVAKCLLPSDTIHLKAEHVRAIITSEGGRSSHSAILARALNIPLISKLNLPLELIFDNSKIIVDGNHGKAVINAPEKEWSRCIDQSKVEEEKKMTVVRKMKRKSLRKDGQPILIKANISTLEEIRLAKRYHCDGIGLYRLEQIYMQSQILPGEEELYKALTDSLSCFPKNREITVRLLDIGGDKTLPYLNLPEQNESALGLRGIRLLLKYPNLLESQLRVLLRLSGHFNIRILVPMISLPDDMKQVRKSLEGAKRYLRRKKIKFNNQIPVGAMIETPSALLAIDKIIALSDFLSIGTNDLLQYTMAADREKSSVQNYYEAGNRLILKWVKELTQKAKSAGIECAVCGELASDFNFTQDLLRCGIRHFSVTPNNIPYLKSEIAKLVLCDAAGGSGGSR